MYFFSSFIERHFYLNHVKHKCMLGLTPWNTNVHKISIENQDKEAESDPSFPRDIKKNRIRIQVRIESGSV
jgi:hypothetical protein